MTRLVSTLVLVLAMAPATRLMAHPGHEHKIMGTVSMVHQDHLEVKATDGKMSMITMDQKTRVLRGTEKVKTDAIKTGDRVVVTAIETKDNDGKPIVLAKEVQLAAMPAAHE
jgi:hypothetical protein